MRVVIVEGTPSLRDALVRLLTERGIEVVGTAVDHDECLCEVARLSPDVVVVDIHLPPDHLDEGLRTVQAIRTRHPEVGILVLSSRAEAGFVHRLVGLSPSGSIGCTLKERLGDPDTLVAALRHVYAGDTDVDPGTNWPGSDR
ncbi:MULTISPECIES: response regulator [Streptomyces]|uniref:response regulator n=1 Tax=Streptomyces TaxID=1883 RepID=UPI00068DE826|nr:response regulator [Streptomyces durhamensis]